MSILRSGIWIVCLVSLAYPTTAQAVAPIMTAPRLEGLSPSDAQLVIGKLVDAQRAVKAGAKVYFDLLSGAPASYDATLVSPRKTFLDFRFENPDLIERIEPPNSLWHPYKLTYFGKKGGDLMWEIDVVLGFENQVERVQMFYKPPPPF